LQPDFTSLDFEKRFSQDATSHRSKYSGDGTDARLGRDFSDQTTKRQGRDNCE